MELNRALLEQVVERRKIFKFRKSQLTSEKPHYHIVIHNDKEKKSYIFACSTTKYEKRKRYIELEGLPETTLVWIKPSDNNGLTENSYIDCNSVFVISDDEFYQKYSEGELTLEGELEEGYFFQICAGIADSPRISNEIRELAKIIIENG